jgi:hypothetical protein
MADQEKVGTDKLGSMISMRLSPHEMKVARKLAESNKTSLSGAVRKAILELGGENGSGITATLGTVNSAVSGTLPTSPTMTSRITLPAASQPISNGVAPVKGH